MRADYRRANVAVNVALAAGAIVCVCAPPSDHETKSYVSRCLRLRARRADRALEPATPTKLYGVVTGCAVERDRQAAGSVRA